MVQSAGAVWWTLGAAVAGLVLGAAASTLTRQFLAQPRALAGARWFGGALTAVVLAFLAWRNGNRDELVVQSLVTVLGVPLAIIDWCEHRLPRALVLPQLAAAAVGFAALSIVRAEPEPGLRALVASVALAAAFLALAVATAGGVGAGDVSLVAVVGLVCGWLGWPQVLGALVVALLLALCLVAIPATRGRDEGGAAVVPFGPCLLGGTLTMVLAAG
ncbi:prepilin peptidase [Amycolatopsis thermalba]|uniref:Prepilin peptidase n=1 Tax=Amycolatopsis thermalba TaxID=944492 RepID=A0ABY4P174_9PSEU|nr:MULTISPECIES: prepilin peptidase [Amycolatopsis]UQS26054.1 prepilin peptidase [Amycolatopsis thermalba]